MLEARLRQRYPGIEVKQWRFFLAGGNGYDYSLKQFRCPLHQIDVAIGNGIKRPRIHHGVG